MPVLTLPSGPNDRSPAIFRFSPTANNACGIGRSEVLIPAGNNGNRQCSYGRRQVELVGVLCGASCEPRPVIGSLERRAKYLLKAANADWNRDLGYWLGILRNRLLRYWNSRDTLAPQTTDVNSSFS